jgi:hypothetical protein
MNKLKWGALLLNQQDKLMPFIDLIVGLGDFWGLKTSF